MIGSNHGACVVNEHVQSAKAGDEQSYEAAAGFRFNEVGRETLGVDTPGTHLVAKCLDMKLLRSIMKTERGAVLGEQAGDCRPYTAAGSGDENAPAFEISEHRPHRATLAGSPRHRECAVR